MLGRVGHAERPAGAVEFAGAARLVFGALEVGQHVGRRPAGVAELAPQVEILVLAADVDHAVDAGRTAEHLAARPEDAPAVGAGIGLGLIAPVHRGVGKGLAVAKRDVDPAVAVLAAGFQQHDARRGIFGQARGHDAAGGTRADHDKIRLERILQHGHRRFLVPRSGQPVARISGSVRNAGITSLAKRRRFSRDVPAAVQQDVCRHPCRAAFRFCARSRRGCRTAHSLRSPRAYRKKP